MAFAWYFSVCKEIPWYFQYYYGTVFGNHCKSCWDHDCLVLIVKRKYSNSLLYFDIYMCVCVWYWIIWTFVPWYLHCTPIYVRIYSIINMVVACKCFDYLIFWWGHSCLVLIQESHVLWCSDGITMVLWNDYHVHVPLYLHGNFIYVRKFCWGHDCFF